jgi:hypothetical protein
MIRQRTTGSFKRHHHRLGIFICARFRSWAGVSKRAFANGRTPVFRDGISNMNPHRLGHYFFDSKCYGDSVLYGFGMGFYILRS